ncbi:MAG: DNA polymerase I [Candidatus Rokuibacteriota bacterium]|nr:MAG: DNA polymerase I [Candidatus Rokubacteria bacterium]PYN57205.1 MAG: DNA polymerase I [Candidatus Rokubacteria bacterium]
MKRLFIVDGHSQIFRAYHAVGYLSTSKGIPTQAVLVLSTMLWKLIREEQPDYLAIALDPPGPTFRDQLSAEYKATRSAMPDDLARQLPYVRRLFDALRTPVLEVAGFEADDVLATLVDQALALPELEVVVVSGDKDLLQLVGPRVRVLSVSGRTGEPILYDEAKVRERWGVEPGQIADVLALMGDTIDNIKGVHGVGEKTAVKLIGQYGSVDRLYENLPLIAGKLRETLAAGRKDALLSRELALLNRKVPVAIDLDTFRRVEPDWAKLRALWMELEFSRLLKELPPAPTASPEPTTILDGAAAGAWLERVPAGAPLAVDWAGEARTPESRISGLALFHPDAGPTAVGPDATPATLGAHELIVHDAKPLLEFWLGRGVELPPVHDTAVAAYLINSARASYRLEQVCMEALGDGPPAADPVHPQGARARFLWRYWEHAAAELRARELWPVYETIERPLIPVLALMERHGIRVDPARLEAFAKELERDLDNLTREIYRLAGEEFTIASPKQLAQILFEKLKLPPLRRTKTGYSTDADVLTELGLRHELPAKILEHRSIAKLKGTYADTLPGLINPRTGRIHTTFNQLVAATGRLSSQDPNLMNIPIRTELGRRIRAAFIPEEGWRFVAADYSQIELRILAHLSEEPALIESFGRGEDIHTRTASEVFHVGAGDVTSLQRTIAKSANYAILYGVSAFGLSQATKIDQKEAKRYIDDYFASHPRVRAYIDRTLAEGRQHGHVSTMLGRRRYLPDLTSPNPIARNAAERMAMNAPVQGTASDMIKIAMVRVQAALAGRGLRARMLLQVHDELLFEAPPDEVATIEELAREIMAAALPLKVPVVVDVKTGADWAEV